MLAMLGKEAARLKLEILDLSEVRWLNSAVYNMPTGQVLLYFGVQSENNRNRAHRGQRVDNRCQVQGVGYKLKLRPSLHANCCCRFVGEEGVLQ